MRPSLDEYFMKMAALVATRSTCLRRSVGCVLINSRGHVLATGYNGVARGMPHCNEVVQVGADFEEWKGGVMYPRRMVDTYPHACSAANAVSGTNLEGCEAIHAEQNALLQCRDPWSVWSAYATTMPCMTCIKLLLNTACERIVYAEEYPHAEAVRALWERSGRTFIQHPVV